MKASTCVNPININPSPIFSTSQSLVGNKLLRCSDSEHSPVSASMKITPHDGVLEMYPSQRSTNLSCTVREVDAHSIDPLQIKWYHNKNEINYQPSSHTVNKYAHNNQATLILYIHNLALNDSGLFTCDYKHGFISKNVQIVFTSSGKATSIRRRIVARLSTSSP